MASFLTDLVVLRDLDGARDVRAQVGREAAVFVLLQRGRRRLKFVRFIHFRFFITISNDKID